MSALPHQGFAFPGDPPAGEAGPAPPSPAPDGTRPAAFSTDIDQARSACRSLTVFGVWAGWGLAVLGLLAGLLHVVDAVAAGVVGPAEWAGILLRAGILVIACVLAGWGARVLSRLTAAAISEYLERFSRASDKLATQAARSVELLASISRALEQRTESGGPGDAARAGKARYLAEIGRATRSAEWVEAETLLREFEVEFPGDPTSAVLWDELAAARRGAIEEGLAQIEAARDVNDPDRLLELYQVLAPSLANEARRTLESDLATWFLSLIHRRLRTGKIQADVVHLAGRFAETFATTAQGASVRASLSTLRRSVGLCPRCAQPYIGIAEACPQCLGGVTIPPAGAATNPASTRRE
ncbi:MAG: hypothetical protein ACHRXM_34390 [Isosphaerales bacterium]